MVDHSPRRPTRPNFILTATLWFAAVLTSGAEPGFIHTSDGRKVLGDVTFTNDALLVATTNGETMRIAANEILRAQFTTNIVTAHAKGTGNGLLGFYYAATNTTGAVILRLDQQIDFDWRESQPMLGIPKDGFSVRWSGYIEAPTTDNYTLHLLADDVGRLFLDDRLLVEYANLDGTMETNATVALKAGERRKLRVEMFDATGTARAKLSWSAPSVPRSLVPQDRLYAESFDPEHIATLSSLAGSQGLLGTYFADEEFRGNSFSRIDPELSFNWAASSPAPGLGSNGFSVRWMGSLSTTNSGDYRFHVMGAAPVRFFLNERLLSNPWLSMEQTYLARIAEGERYSVRLEMRVTNNFTPIRLMWSGPGFERVTVPRHHLSPNLSPAPDPESAPNVSPRGIVLASGAIIDAPIASATETAVRVRGLFGKQPIALSRVSRIHIKPLTSELENAIPRGRAGVLLKNRDFIDGEFAGIEGGRVRIGSVLFGQRSFDLNRDVVAISIRSSATPRAGFALFARDGTILYTRAPRVQPGQAGASEDPALTIPSGELIEITRRLGP